MTPAHRVLPRDGRQVWSRHVATALVLAAMSGCAGTAGSSVESPYRPTERSSATAGTSSAPGSSAATRPPDARLAGTPTSQTYPFRPTTLTLPSGTVAPIDPAGVDAAQALQVPADPARLGWWTGGALVGEPFGSVVLAGHVDSRTAGLGVMVELLDIAIGADVLVGDGTEQRLYRVVSVDAVPKARLAADFQAFRQDVEHRLVLITCGGDYDSVTHSYADNVVAIAAPVG